MLARLKRWYVPTATALVGVYAMVAFVWMPSAIGAAYAGEGLGLLRRAMSARTVSPVEEYLFMGDSFARLQLYRLVTALLIGYVGLRVWSAFRGTARRLDSVPEPGPFAPVLIGVWFGLLSGFGEGYYAAFHTGVLRRFMFEFYMSNLNTSVLAPVMNGLLFGFVGLLLVSVARSRGALAAVRIAVALFASLTAAGWLFMSGSIHVLAGAVLVVGVAVRTAGIDAERLARFSKWVGPAALRGSAIVAALALANAALPAVRVARANDAVAADSGRPNVLWIVIDTERAASLELYGYDRATSPWLSDLARRGVVFDQAMAPASWTLPSHASMFTGRPASELNLWGWAALPALDVTLAEVLRSEGYRTAGFGGNPVFLTPSFGLAQGFTEWSSTTLGLRALGASSWASRHVWRFVLNRLGEADYLVLNDAADTNKRLIRWLSDLPDSEPWFSFVNYFDVHEPFDARPNHMDGPLGDDAPTWFDQDLVAEAYTPETLDALRRAYESEIGWLDAELDRLFVQLEAQGDLDQTLIVITSDHGEQFGEHGLVEHANSLYRQLLHVPLLFVLPDGGAAGSRIAAPVAVEDVAASILDVVGSAADFPGTSLAPYWRGRGSPRPVISSHDDGQSVVFDGFHYITWPSRPSEELYRIEDEGELHDLAGLSEYAEVLERMQMILEG